jgi:hypothetical protein
MRGTTGTLWYVTSDGRAREVERALAGLPEMPTLLMKAVSWYACLLELTPKNFEKVLSWSLSSPRATEHTATW